MFRAKIENAIKQCEKNFDFSNIKSLQKELKTLKKQEEKIVFKKINSVHEKEKQFLNSKYGEMYKTFNSKKK